METPWKIVAVYGVVAAAVLLLLATQVDWTNEWARKVERSCAAENPAFKVAQIGTRGAQMLCLHPDGSYTKPKFFPSDMTAEYCANAKAFLAHRGPDFVMMTRTDYEPLTVAKAISLCQALTQEKQT